MFNEAVKRLFLDPKKLIWSAILYLIPIVNFISWGYMCVCARSAYKGLPGLPVYANYGRLFMNGLKLFIISLIYILPVYALLSIAMTFYLSVDDLLGFPLYAISIILVYLMPLAFVRFAVHGRIVFAFQGIFKHAFTKLYLKTIVQIILLLIPYFLIFSVIAYIFYALLSWMELLMMPAMLIAMAFGSVAFQITFMTVLSKIYRKLE